MRGIWLLFFTVGFLGWSKKDPGAAEQKFWKWFTANEGVLFNFEEDQDRIFDQLQTQLHKVNQDLTFEFGPVQDSRREFVISAGGIKSAFPSVESLFAAAPQLPRWHFIRFRPRRTPMDISYAGISVQAETVLARLSADGAKPDIVLYMPGYSEAASRAFIGIAFLLLDHAIGEYDVEMSVGDISVRDIKDAPPGSLRLEQLPFEFDRMLPKQ